MMFHIWAVAAVAMDLLPFSTGEVMRLAPGGIALQGGGGDLLAADAERVRAALEKAKWRREKAAEVLDLGLQPLDSLLERFCRLLGANRTDDQRDRGEDGGYWLPQGNSGSSTVVDVGMGATPRTWEEGEHRALVNLYMKLTVTIR